MSELHIYLDLDGVMVDFVSMLLKLCNSTLTHDDVDRWDMHECMGIDEDEMWDRINGAGFGFWSHIPKYQWADELYGMISAENKVTYLTSPGRSPHACFGKLQHIQREHGNLHMDWVLTKQKSLLAKDAGCVLIDDSDHNCEQFIKAGGNAILFPQPWNENRHLTEDRMGAVFNRLEKIKKELFPGGWVSG